jgi:hypothetical protein
MNRPLFASLCALLLINQSLHAQTDPGKPAPDAPSPDGWVNITDKPPGLLHHSQGIAVDPTTGNLYLYVRGSLSISKDQGETWTPLPCSITGPTETGFSINLAYPFTGKMAIFTHDGKNGMTLDGGATWQVFEPFKREYDFGDIDWNSATPGVIAAAVHEPWSRAISSDGGKTWKSVDADIKEQTGRCIRVGLFDARTMLLGRSDADGVSISHDMGATWTKTADFRPLGSRPVHYGAKAYWNSAGGVMTSDNGADWKLVGTAQPNATWGPYFGKSEDEMMVVSNTGIFLTLDAAKSWKKVADYPLALTHQKYDKNSTHMHFAWDPIHDIVYVSIGAGWDPVKADGSWQSTKPGTGAGWRLAIK